MTVIVGPVFLAPQSVLQEVSRVELRVFETTNSATCDEASGALSGGLPSTPIATAEMSTSNCAEGVRFCGRLDLARSNQQRLFVATAFAGSSERAKGCSTAALAQEFLPLRIKLVRAVPPSVCSNGTVEATEQCEPTADNDPVCDSTCRSREVALSKGTASAGTLAGAPGEKTRPVFVWPAGSGREGRFLAFFNDRSPPNLEIGMRVLGSDFGPYREQGKAIETGAFFLPHVNGSVVSSTPQANDQLNAAAVALGTSYYVVFQSNDGTPTGTFDIHLRSLDDSLVPRESAGTPVVINGDDGSGEAGSQSFPAIASGPNGLLFVAWQDDSAGKVFGRTWSPANRTLGPTTDLGAGSSNRYVSLAGLPGGWIATWQSGTNVVARRFDGAGSPLAPEFIVNGPGRRGSQERPVVSALPDGRFAIAWTDSGAPAGASVYLQRFDATGAPSQGDQTEPVHDLASGGDQSSAAIAASPESGGFYAVVWLDETSGQVRARFVKANGGFLFNNVTGQSSEFVASIASRRTRGAPTVAIGGQGPFVAIGWEDRTDDEGAGIYGRRFPIPSN